MTGVLANWRYKFSGTAFLAETAGNGVWESIRDANLDPMVLNLLKLDKWRRKNQFSITNP